MSFLNERMIFLKKQRILWLMLCVTLLLLVSVLLSCTAQNGNGSHTSGGETVSAETPEPLVTESPDKNESESDSVSVSAPAETDPTEETTSEPAAETTAAPSDTDSAETTEKPDETTRTPETTTEPSADLTYGSEIGSYCPIVSLDSYNGKGTVSLSDTRGKVTVLNFWATWCPPCVSELLGEFPRVTEYYGDRVAIMAVHVTQISGSVQAYLDANCKDFDMIFCQDAFLSQTDSFYTLAGGEGYVPYTLVLDEAGKIVWKHTGATDFETLKGVIDGILNNK
jgi:thiol-disulfide isomerase/thioredoxin